MGDEDGPRYPWLPPEDRLWRHPSESTGAALPVPAPSAPWAQQRLPPGWGRTLGVALIAGLIGAFGASGIGLAAGWWGHSTTVVRSVFPTTPVVTLADAGATASINWTPVDDSVATSVVGITVQTASGPQQGSGLLLATSSDGQGYVVTDRSIFSSGESTGYIGRIDVTFLSGVTGRGKLLGQDPLSGLAVIAVANSGRDTPAATGTVADLRQAQQVLAVGSRTASLATGAVSAEDRTVPLSNGSDMDGLIAVSMDAMTASATGGPLVDQFGRVVGVTVDLNPVDDADQQLTFAVPIDEVGRVASAIIGGRNVYHPWIGMTNAGDLPSEAAHQLGIAGGVQAGQVVPGGPAQKAGLSTNDVVTAFNGKPVQSVGQLTADLMACQPGTSVPVTFVHDGHTEHTLVAVAAEPNDAP